MNGRINIYTYKYIGYDEDVLGNLKYSKNLKNILLSLDYLRKCILDHLNLYLRVTFIQQNDAYKIWYIVRQKDTLSQKSE